MVELLNDGVEIEGKVTTKAELLAEGGVTIGPGGLNFGDSVDDVSSWPAQTRVQVANIAERDALEVWRAANSPISASNPCLVWRKDGSLTGVNEITIDGTNWYAETPLSGDVEMTIATTAPYGWLLMQGQLLANAATNYPALWAAASTALREGSGLRIPDMRGRVPMGAGTGTGLTLRNLGDKTGAETVTLTEAQMPSHTHLQDAHTHVQNQHRHGPGAYDRFGVYEDSVSSETVGAIDGSGWKMLQTNGETTGSTVTAYATPTNQNTTAVNQEAGSDQAHANVQPSLVLNFKVKV